MTTTITNLDQISKIGGSAFIPMSEEQMAATKGGTDWPDWVEDAIEVIEGFLQFIQDQIDNLDDDDAFWEDLQDEMDELGVEEVTEEMLLLDW